MPYNEITAKVMAILNTLVSPDIAANITESSKITDDLDIHSILWVELMVELEDTFKVRIKNVNFHDTATVADVAELVTSLLSAQPAAKAS